MHPTFASEWGAVFAQLNSRAQSGFARLEVALSRTNWRVAKLLQEFLFSSVWYLLYSYSGQPTGARQTSMEKKDSQSPSFNTYSSQVLTQQRGSNEIRFFSRDVELCMGWKGWFMCDRSELGRGWTWGHGVTRTLYSRIEDWVCPLYGKWMNKHWRVTLLSWLTDILLSMIGIIGK